MRKILIAAVALTLGGCGTAPEQNVTSAEAVNAEANAVTSNGSDGNVLGRINAMSERERNVVLVRALMDANLPCDGVKHSTSVEGEKGVPTWKVECVNGTNHLIGITPDGTAHILSRSTP